MNDHSEWYWDHVNASLEVLDFISGDGITVVNQNVVDIGSGDGILTAAFAERSQCAQAIGIDINPVNEDALLAYRLDYESLDSLPNSLTFVESSPFEIPLPSQSTDLVISWSAFEHIANPLLMLREIERILKPDGNLFLQLYPFFYSQHGGHLHEWFPQGFVDLCEDVVKQRLLSENSDASLTKLTDYAELNRIEPTDLFNDLHTAGLEIRKIELLSHAVHIPEHTPPSEVLRRTIGGVKFIANKA